MKSQATIEPAWLSVRDTAKYAGCGRTAVYEALHKQVLDGRIAFGRTLISKASIDEMMASAPPFGTRSKSK